jgi:Flp pilus assembly protein TadG
MWRTVPPERQRSPHLRTPYLAPRHPTGAHTPARHTYRDKRRDKRLASRGQSLVEFVMIFPLIMLLVLGASDVATLLDNHLDVVYTARTAARMGSILGTAPAADCAIIGAIRAAMSSVRNVQVSSIVIYQAGADGQAIGAKKDVYQGATVCNADGTTSPGATSLGWPPGQRSTTPLFEDSIGVEIDYSYTFQLDLLGMGQFTSADRAVMPLEVVIGTPIPPSGVGV